MVIDSRHASTVRVEPGGEVAGSLVLINSVSLTSDHLDRADEKDQAVAIEQRRQDLYQAVCLVLRCDRQEDQLRLSTADLVIAPGAAQARSTRNR